MTNIIGNVFIRGLINSKVPSKEKNPSHAKMISFELNNKVLFENRQIFKYWF